MYDCDYCRDTYEDPEHHLSVDVKAALDRQQIGPGGCPACHPEWATPGAMEFYEAETRNLR